MSAGGERQFVDTNILVYAHDKSAGEKHVRAKALVAGLWDNRCGCLSVQVLQEFYVTVTQKVDRLLAFEEASRIIANLAHWHVHAPLAADVLEAIKIQQRYRLSFWDAMIIRSAQALGCGILWTEDLNQGQVYEEIKVLNPFFSGW
ncbi:PIN domain-containing protein [Desulfofundulus thermobenzoicus]|uniref:PIN domain-containing protein n=2 Tax=Desulfofundulus thermobenzoicus TaxID=29376 RepID=A0A6N7IW08_9FIRM|nr:PIN domain-containing protein [Desulfofundulus thermobenzoicus]MQL53657.1 PIN domain-containing protein [Desulfofundulus thermobenzoicus]